ncbi:MAG: glycosyltransferase family 2 protein [Myxococcota bacterium]
MTGLTVSLGVLSVLVLLPAMVFTVECLASALPARRRRGHGPEGRGPMPRAVVVVPAHDEEAGIADTVRHLRARMEPDGRLLVVADNCRDGTAARARTAGAEVVERHAPRHRGKGHALTFAFEYLAPDAPDVVVVVDADCRVSLGAIRALVRSAARTGRPVQAEYLMQSPDGDACSAVSSLAFLVRNRVRPRGLARLGLPCHLTGSGMALPWSALRAAPPTEDHLVEDLLLGVELAKAGHPPLLCTRAMVSSVLPRGARPALAQRRRWEHGQLRVALTRGPQLLWHGIVQLRPALVALGLDLLVPPLALLVVLQLSVLVLGLGGVGLGASPVPAILAGAAIGTVALGVAVSIVAYGRGVIRPRVLLAVPAYILRKVPSYIAFALRRGQRTWQRAERSPEAER